MLLQVRTFRFDVNVLIKSLLSNVKFDACMPCCDCATVNEKIPSRMKTGSKVVRPISFAAKFQYPIVSDTEMKYIAVKLWNSNSGSSGIRRRT